MIFARYSVRGAMKMLKEKFGTSDVDVILSRLEDESDKEVDEILASINKERNESDSL